MRTRKELDRLTEAGRPLLAEADSLVDSGEKDRILERILASDRPSLTRRRRATKRAALVLIGAAVLVAAASVAVLETGRGAPLSKGVGRHPHRLNGAAIQLAGYRFKTPAGFKASSDSCIAASSSAGPVTVKDAFAAAASADGGCIEGFVFVSANGTTPADNGAEPVAVGDYQGYYVPQGASGESTLYVLLPTESTGGSDGPHYLALFAEGLTEQQLIAIAQSGLPGNP